MNKKKYLREIIWLKFILMTLSLSTVLAAAPTDFDGDGKSDFVAIRYAPDGTLNWLVLRSRDGFYATGWGRDFNGSTDLPVISDYDGDGKVDIAVWRYNFQTSNPIPSYWYVLRSSDNSFLPAQWGASFDDLVQADYDGDGKADFAVYRDGWWYVMRSRDGFYAEKFGLPEDFPMRGNDYDGDGKADLAVTRYLPHSPGSAVPTEMYIRLSSNGSWRTYNVGDARFTWVVSGDYDGDGKSDVALWQNRQWLWLRSSDNQLGGVQFGQPGDSPVPGDYDGDGKTDPAVIRAEGVQRYYYILQSRDGFKAIQWGNANTDVLVTSLSRNSPVGF
ncbi:MAG TPA: VCBS repeat-containing protein [Pyrinomonadaceae bacterium]|nr:VCBS repeat-containing protein [Pyrinomonadaceae bacterium]